MDPIIADEDIKSEPEDIKSEPEDDYESADDGVSDIIVECQ